MSHAILSIYFYLKKYQQGALCFTWKLYIKMSMSHKYLDMRSNGLGGIRIRNINLAVINSFKYYMCKKLQLLTSPMLSAAEKWELKSWIDEIYESKHVIKARKQLKEHWYLKTIFMGSDMATESDEEEKM